ncbi:MAG: ribosome-associated translation inhibitor RaiA [Clostridia bacterium]|nr:ribosome-associated translation inhibitor RaiA [Clostridia bacterium]
MRIDIVGKNYTVSDRLDDIIRRKAERLDRFFSDDVTARVVCKEEHKGRFTLEITIIVDGVVIRSEETSDNMYNNIDVVVPKIDRQIRKHRTRLTKKFKDSVFNFQVAEAEAIELNDTQEAEVPSIVKTKKFELQPMSVEEAIEQMDLLENKFFVYLNPESGKVNIVYRRYDKTVGLIQPEY